MSIRTTLQPLITYVRMLVGEVGDCACEDSLSDEQIQRALDDTREKVRCEPLWPCQTVFPGAYLDWEASDGWLDDTWQLSDSAHIPLAEEKIAESDPLRGQWTLSDRQIYLYLSGNRYDPFEAAANLLECLAAKAKREVDFRDSAMSVSSSQASRTMLDLAREYRKRQRVRSIQFGRSDIT